MRKKMVTVNSERIEEIMEFLKEQKAQNPKTSLDDIMRLSEVMAEGFKDFFHQLDEAVYCEFTDIAKTITTMKRELRSLQNSDMRTHKLPEAGKELNEVVNATETATNTIMEAAEAIMAADTSDANAYQTIVNDNIIEIFQACSFQDITGQRISKVVNTLDYIDSRISVFAERLNLKIENKIPTEETESEKRQRELILHGPQMTGEGVDQSEIDALLSDD